MRKYGSLLLVLVLATASLLAAAAYNTATVTNAGSLRVTSTDTAVLALGAHGGIGNKDKTAELVGGDLVFQFGRGIAVYFGGDVFRGFQHNSVYVWGTTGASNTGMFYVQNRSAETLTVDMKLTSAAPLGVKVELGGTAGWSSIPWVDVSDGLYHTIFGTLGASCSFDVNVRITVNGTASTGTYDAGIVVQAIAK